MAMKVSKLTIHRLSVDMSCGCKMYAEFDDAQCKKSLVSWNEEEGPCPRIFLSCDKHKKDASLSMLEFIISERLDEAIEEAQKTPVHLHSLPEEGDTGGVPGGQSVAKVNRPAAVGRVRPEGGPTIKTLQRSNEQLAKVGAVIGSSMDAEISGGVTEDVNTTDNLGDILDAFDLKELNEG